MAQLVARDADAHRLLGPREPAAIFVDHFLCEQRAAGQLQLGPQVVEVPLQRAVERHARPDQTLAVVDQQPQVEFAPGQGRGWERRDASAQRRASDGQRVDLIALAAVTTRATCAGHPPG
jgi:hypothetical protein